MKHVKHAIFWSSPSTAFYEACQARKHVKSIESTSTPSTRARKTREPAKHVKHAKHASMQARHLANPFKSYRINSSRRIFIAPLWIPQHAQYIWANAKFCSKLTKKGTRIISILSYIDQIDFEDTNSGWLLLYIRFFWMLQVFS